LEDKIGLKDPPTLYLEDILDANEALDVWSDMNDLEKTAPIEDGQRGRSVVEMSRETFRSFGR
jgi:hypothetical protein